MLSSTQFFVLGAGPSSPYTLYMYKITFLSTVVNWANQMAWLSGTWAANDSESLLSLDSSSIYWFFIYGSTPYLYFAVLSVSDGSVGSTRYKSSIAVNQAFGSALNADYAVVSTNTPNSLVIYSISSSILSIISTTSSIYGLNIEPTSGR